MNEQPSQFDARLDAYLDGRMTEAQCAEFEQDAAANVEVRNAFTRQRALDESLRRSFPGPRLQASPLTRNGQIRAAADDAAPATSGALPFTRSPLIRTTALAAGLALLAGGAWIGWTLLGKGTTSPTPPGQTATIDAVPDVYTEKSWQPFPQIYQDAVATGFEPDWVCETDEQFQTIFRERFGQPVLIADLPDDRRMIGLLYCNSLSPKTVAVLSEVRGEKAIVFIDLLEEDDPQPPQAYQDINLHRTTLGDLVMYELTPLDQPLMLEYFFNPDDRDNDGAPPSS